jgi:hypothetical protein
MMRRISVALAILCSGALLSSQSPTSTSAQVSKVHDLSSGVIRFPNGITVHYRIESSLQPLLKGKQNQQGFGPSGLPDASIQHHLFFAGDRYCGYDLTAEAIPGTDKIQLSFEPLSIDWPGQGSKIPAPQPALPPAQAIAPGEEIVMDLAKNPATGDVISEHLTAETGPAEASSEPHDFTLEDVPLHLALPTLIEDGRVIGQSRFSDAVPIFAMQLPEGEWLYLSIKPHEGYAFQRAGVIDSARAHFNLNGHSYELRSRAQIVPDGFNKNLYVMVDTREPASRGTFFYAPGPFGTIPRDPLNLHGGTAQRMLPKP